MTIRNRMMISAGVSIGILLVVTVLQVVYIDRAVRNTGDSQAIVGFHYSVVELNLLTDQYVLYHEQNIEKRWLEKYEDVHSKLNEVEELLRYNILDESLESMYSAFLTYVQLHNQTHDHEAGIIDPNSERQEFLRNRILGRMQVEAHRLLSISMIAYNESLNKTQTVHRRVQLVSMIGLSAVAIFVLVGMMLTYYKINRSVQNMVKGTEEIRKGNFEVQIQALSNDEMDLLSDAFNQLKAELLGEQKFITMAIDSLQDTFFVFDPATGQAIRWNNELQRISGYSYEEIAAMKAPDAYYAPADLQKLTDMASFLEEDLARTVNLELIKKDGGKVLTEYTLTSFSDDRADKIYVVAIGRDIRERYKREQQIVQALEEKNTLLKELYHRTKNNMELITSYMNLQVESPGVDLHYFHESIKKKILSMSLVHKQLYESENLSEIELENYLRELIGLFRRSNASSDTSIGYTLNAAPVVINIDAAIPFGLVISELITNSQKHAFPARETGTVSIEVSRDEGILHCTYRDNGTGLKDDLDTSSPEHFGLSIIRTIIEYQLDGSVDFYNDNGFVCKISFDLSQFTRRI